VSSEDSITCWLEGVRRGDPLAAEELWNRCFPELVRFAREKLRAVPRRAADEEDVALSAMDSFCRALQKGRLGDLADRNDFLRLVLRMTARKAADLIRRQTTQRRGEGHVRGDSALDGLDSASGKHPLADDACAPELAAMVADEVRHLLAVLDDAELEAVALAKAEGATNEEIAERFRCSKRTVARRLRLIRAIWEEQQSP
jgi:RNA polymerase sigma factor (sigma-70 family)